jgi:uncharacterized protein (TIGR02611 family)
VNVPGVHAARAVVMQSVGWFVLVVGIIMIPAPGPGLLVTVLGLAILQRYNSWARRMMAPVKLRAVRGAAESVESTSALAVTTLGLLGLLAFAFNHPFFLAIGLTVGLSVGSAAVAGDVESGRALLWYTRPVPRSRLLRGRIAFWLLAQTVVVAFAVLGGVLASALSEDLGGDGMQVALRAGVQFLPLGLAVGAMAFAVSAFVSTRARALGGAVGIAFLAYLVNFTSLLWSAAEPLRWITPNVVTEAEPGKVFAFRTTTNRNVWGYRFEPEGDGTLVTEFRQLPAKRPWYAMAALAFLGGAKRYDAGVPQGMRTTLERLKVVAESAPTPSDA